MEFRIQMDVDNRKTESKTGLKRMDIAMEVRFTKHLYHKYSFETFHRMYFIKRLFSWAL